jgi:hypothetical protein
MKMKMKNYIDLKMFYLMTVARIVCVMLVNKLTLIKFNFKFIKQVYRINLNLNFIVLVFAAVFITLFPEIVSGTSSGFCECLSVCCYSTKSKVSKIKPNSEDTSVKVENNVKETEEIRGINDTKEIKVLDINETKIKASDFEEIKGLIFYKSNNEIRINYPLDIDCKKAYESIQSFLLDIQKIDSKGFLNTTNLNDIPVISNFIKYFTDNERYISGGKVVDSYK